MALALAVAIEADSRCSDLFSASAARTGCDGCFGSGPEHAYNGRTVHFPPSARSGVQDWMSGDRQNSTRPPEVQRFLELAQPILLERGRQLDDEAKIALARMAKGCGLSKAQLQEVLIDLSRQQVVPATAEEVVFIGDDDVVDDAPLRPVSSRPEPPKPPPLPAGRQRQTTPPPPPAPEPVADRGSDRSAVSIADVTPLEVAANEITPVELSAGAKRAVFSIRARQILAEQKGMTPAAQVLLKAAAQEAGLGEDDMLAALQSLEVPDPDVVFLEATPTPPPPPSHFGDLDPTAPPEPPPSTVVAPKRKKKPRDSFRSYVNRAFDAMSTPVVTSKKETRLAREGCKKLGISETWARWLIYELANERGLPVLSRQQEEQAAQPGDEAKLEAFLERATLIIAEQRGVNVKSRMLMETVADELELSSAAYERGLALLQGTGRKQQQDAEAQLQTQQAEFATALEESLLAHASILHAALEDELVEIGEELHGLPEDRSRPQIREVAKKLGLHIISVEQARQHIAEIVDEKMTNTARIGVDVRMRIHQEGAQWGLDSEQIDEVIEDCVDARKRQRAKTRQIRSASLAFAVLAVCAVAGAGGWIFLKDQFQPTSIPTIDSNLNASSGAATAGGVGEEPAPGWVDKDLHVALTRARILINDQKTNLQRIQDGDEADRSQAYASLLRVAGRGDRSERESLTAVIAGCYALEPSDDNASYLRETLVGIMSEDLEKVDGEAAVVRVFWAARTALASLMHMTVAEERADVLGRAIGSAFGVVVDRTLEMARLEQDVFAPVCKRLYGRLTALAGAADAAADADDVGSLHEQIQIEGRRYLDPAEQEKFETDFLVSLLPSIGDDWVEYEESIRRGVSSEDPHTVLKYVELFEEVEDRELQLFLGGRLLRRTGLLSEPIALSEIAAEVRTKLGVVKRVTNEDRYKQFKSQADGLLSRLGAKVADTDAMAREIVELTHMATLGAALSKGEFGSATFDELVDSGPAKVKAPVMAPSAPPIYGRRIGESLNDDLNRKVQAIASLSRPNSRIMVLTQLVGMGEIPDLPPPAAYGLAKYLVSPKSINEHRAMMPLVPTVGKWPTVRLGLADELNEVSSKDEQVVELMTAVLGREITETEPLKWRREVRQVLLSGMLRDLQSKGSSLVSSGVYDVVANIYRDTYKTQAKVRGVAAEQYLGAESAADVLKLLVDQSTAQLSGSGVGGADGAYLKELPHLRAALDYLSEDNLSATANNQRVYLRLIAIETRKTRPELSSGVDEVLADLEASDQKATHVLAQIRTGEAAAVKLWLLHSQPK